MFSCELIYRRLQFFDSFYLFMLWGKWVINNFYKWSNISHFNAFSTKCLFVHIWYDFVEDIYIISEWVWKFFSKFIWICRNCWWLFPHRLQLDALSSSKNADRNTLYTIMAPTADVGGLNLSWLCVVSSWLINMQIYSHFVFSTYSTRISTYSTMLFPHD